MRAARSRWVGIRMAGAAGVMGLVLPKSGSVGSFQLFGGPWTGSLVRSSTEARQWTEPSAGPDHGPVSVQGRSRPRTDQLKKKNRCNWSTSTHTCSLLQIPLFQLIKEPRKHFCFYLSREKTISICRLENLQRFKDVRLESVTALR